MSHTCTCAHTCAYTPICFAHLHTTRGARPLYSACLLMISWFPQNEGLWLTPTWESSRKRRVNDGRESNVLSELKLFFDPWCVAFRATLTWCALSVLVHLGCHHKIPQTRWLISKHLYVTVLGSLRSWTTAYSVSGEDLLPHGWLSFCYNFTGWRG